MRNTLKDRLALEGMPPDRADNIPYAAAMLGMLYQIAILTRCLGLNTLLERVC